MSQSSNALIKETISLLEQAKLECDDTESCVSEVLDQAIQKLVHLEQSSVCDQHKGQKTLLIIARVFESLPEFQALLESLGLL